MHIHVHIHNHSDPEVIKRLEEIKTLIVTGNDPVLKAQADKLDDSTKKLETAVNNNS